MTQETDLGHVPEGADASVESELPPVEPEGEQEVMQADDGEAESRPAEDQDLEENKDSFDHDRLERLVRYRRQAEQEADAIRSEYEALRKEVDELRSKAPQDAPATKTLADFDYNEAEYAAFLRQEATEQARAAAREEAGRIAQEERARFEFEQKQAAFSKRAAEFAKDQADFFELTQDRNLPITREMAEVMYDSDIGPAMAYYLAKHPDEAFEISRSSPAAQGRRLGDIEAKLASALAKKSKAKTDAPPAQKQRVKGTEPGFNTNPKAATSDKMSDAEWLKRREAQIAKANG